MGRKQAACEHTSPHGCLKGLKTVSITEEGVAALLKLQNGTSIQTLNLSQRLKRLRSYQTKVLQQVLHHGFTKKQRFYYWVSKFVRL